MDTLSPIVHRKCFSLSADDSQRLDNLRGPDNEHLQQLEKVLQVTIEQHGHDFQVVGGLPHSVELAETVIKSLYHLTEKEWLSKQSVLLHLQANADYVRSDAGQFRLKTKRGMIHEHNKRQRQYLENIQTCAVNFGIGPAGTGKTYLAVACAISALEQQLVNRIILVRPAVEAGERLGFLPGDMVQKVDPYLRPLYDALYEMMGGERVNKYMAQNMIEVAPLAFMRGRTLNDSFVILDEAQNTTIPQMKMFLTRLGYHSTVVVTGDITQIDLPHQEPSGLCHVIDVLRGEAGISFTFFKVQDVERHSLVINILNAYARYEKKHS